MLQSCVQWNYMAQRRESVGGEERVIYLLIFIIEIFSLCFFFTTRPYIHQGERVGLAMQLAALNVNGVMRVA